MFALIMTLTPIGMSAADGVLIGDILILHLVVGLTIGAFSGWLWLIGNF